MHARRHTEVMLRWWSAWVDHADLAIRRSCGTMLWTLDRELDRLPLSWARAENARGAEIYIRPARGYAWPLLFLDDLTVKNALGAARCYGALAVHTSPVGGCHVWLPATETLDEVQRKACQQHIAARVDADPASTSGEHLGRLAGFRNHKRLGAWVNVLDAPDGGMAWTPPREILSGVSPPRARPGRGRCSGVDRSPSGQDWAWVCRQINAGIVPQRVIDGLVERCRDRRGPDAERYARRTVRQAMDRFGLA